MAWCELKHKIKDSKVKIKNLEKIISNKQNRSHRNLQLEPNRSTTSTNPVNVIHSVRVQACRTWVPGRVLNEDPRVLWSECQWQ